MGGYLSVKVFHTLYNFLVVYYSRYDSYFILFVQPEFSNEVFPFGLAIELRIKKDSY